MMLVKSRWLIGAVAVLLSASVLAGCATKTPAKPNPIPFAGKPVNKYDKFYEEKDGVKHFYFWIEEKEQEILKGVMIPVWSFNGSVPGPEIRVQQGDHVKVHFRNTSSQPHSIHFHGQLGLDQKNDGVPATSHAVPPQQEYTYEFIADSTGTLMYHCHVATYNHLDMGMYGPFVVEPKGETKTWTKEFNLMLDDWSTTIDPFASPTKREYNYFTVNGKAFPETEAVEGKVGETIKLRFYNVGYRSFSMHSHGYGMLVTHLDGFPLAQPYTRDTLTMGPGERYDVLITVREGIFPWHDHQLENTLNNGEYLGGATFLVIGKK